MVQHPPKSLKDTPQLQTIFSVDCKNIYNNTVCYCPYCSRIVYSYICQYNKKTPCFDKAKFKSFKKFIQHLDSSHKTKTAKSNPSALSKKIKKIYHYLQPEWIPCSEK